jgi:L-2,4-diaminobutyrate decarboxylase
MNPQDIYDPEFYGAVSEVLARELQNHFAGMPDLGFAEPRTPAELIQKASQFLENKSDEPQLERARQTIREFIKSATHLHSPYNMGHQVSAPAALAGAFAGLGASLNPGLAVFEMSRFGMGIEHALIKKLNTYVGWDAEASGGIVTSGGTLANMTAILSARNWKFAGAFKDGMQDCRPALFTSEDSHYSIARAAGVLGIGTEQVIKVPLNPRTRRIDPSQLPRIYKETRNRGLEPFCIVAASGTTPVGAFDPLEEIAAFAEAHELWMHVDGAHGAPFLMGDQSRHLLKGAEKADSLTWDAHKMMYVPSLCTFLLYRDRRESYLPFQQEAPYLFGGGDEQLAYDNGLRTFECTKGPLTLPLFALWSIYGEGLFTSMMDKVVQTTHACYEIIKDASDFAAAHEPECNIFCFRYTPSETAKLPAAEMDKYQREVRERLIRGGKMFITGTSLDGVYALRITIMNPTVTTGHFVEILDAIRGG